MPNDGECEEYVGGHCTGYAIYEPPDESSTPDSSKLATQSSGVTSSSYDKQDTGSRIGWNGWPYQTDSTGTNSQGNRYESRDYGPDVPDQNAYRYSNEDGSYYYRNPDGSSYYNDGNGYSRFERPEQDDQTAQEDLTEGPVHESPSQYADNGPQVDGDDVFDVSDQTEDSPHASYDQLTESDGQAEYGYQPEYSDESYDDEREEDDCWDDEFGVEDEVYENDDDGYDYGDDDYDDP